ncbi:hypothetical protein E2C01_101173 [Portunus trituberculatus]|uniref:Uncharacterized protein n=1 Tax=Portunus trituberculatus TaxID=210409 RepID=A0A5B7KE27_PORTR|nr:hypothetical protein [Portunus trituberculatus]
MSKHDDDRENIVILSACTVYVTSSSTIVLGSSETEANLYDAAYSPDYYNASLHSASTSSSLYYESAKIRSIFYEDGDQNEDQEISLFLEGWFGQVRSG